MVRNYKRKGEKRAWTQEAMQDAVDAVINNAMGYHKAAVVFSVPQTTLERHVKKQKNNPSQRLTRTSEGSGSYRCVFSKEQEAVLVDYLTRMKDRLFGLNAREVRSLAFQQAYKNGQGHRFNWVEELAGVEWLFAFRKRHRDLFLRKAESYTSSTGISKVAVDKFYDLLEQFESQGLTADRIFNADEVGIVVNPNTRSRVTKARRQGVLDKGHIVTAEVCFSAAGTFMPPMLVFPSDEVHNEFYQGLPSGAQVHAHPTGCFTIKLFMEWFRHFVIFSKATKESPVVLLVDGQSPHIKNLDLIDLANENGVELLCFPTHSLPRLQPIDVSFFKLLYQCYEEEVRLWLQTHPGHMISSFQVSPLLGSAYRRTSAPSTAINSFSKSGVWPAVRLAVFHEDESRDDNSKSSNAHGSHASTSGGHQDDRYAKKYSRIQGPAGSKAVLPFRGAAPLTPILKSHSYRPGLKALKKTNDGCKIEKKACDEKKVNAAASPKSNSSPPSGDSQDNYDPQCLYCNDFYSNATDGWWICCAMCRLWAHHSCAGFDGENDQVSVHVCKTCSLSCA